jgi:FkbM family methyltransferase
VNTRTQRFLKRQVKKVLRRMGLRVERVSTGHAAAPAPPTFERQFKRTFETLLEERLAQSGEDFFFIQIGAHDGVSFDRLYRFVTKHDAAGLVVEPIAHHFEALSRNYAAHPRVTPVRRAIHATADEIEMHLVDPQVTGLARWTSGISSVDPDHHRRSGTPSEAMITQRVPCSTWERLLEDHAVTSVDLLQIDAEGYDFEILQMLDLDRCKPKVIKFEHRTERGVMTREQLGQCYERFNAAGYYFLVNRADAIAYLRPLPSRKAKKPASAT